MSRIVKPLLSQFEIEMNEGHSTWNPEMEMTSSDQLCGARLVSRDVQSLNAPGATTSTRVRQETIDDD